MIDLELPSDCRLFTYTKVLGFLPEQLRNALWNPMVGKHHLVGPSPALSICTVTRSQHQWRHPRNTGCCRWSVGVQPPQRGHRQTPGSGRCSSLLRAEIGDLAGISQTIQSLCGIEGIVKGKHRRTLEMESMRSLLNYYLTVLSCSLTCIRLYFPV